MFLRNQRKLYDLIALVVYNFPRTSLRIKLHEMLFVNLSQTTVAAVNPRVPTKNRNGDAATSAELWLSFIFDPETGKYNPIKVLILALLV